MNTFILLEMTIFGKEMVTGYYYFELGLNHSIVMYTLQTDKLS